MSMSQYASSADYWKAQAEANAKDAERYRWLRTQHWSDGVMAVAVDPKKAIKLGQYCPSFGLLDDAIDAAMAASTTAPQE